MRQLLHFCNGVCAILHYNCYYFLSPTMPSPQTPSPFTLAAFLLAAAAMLLACFAWGSTYQWHIPVTTFYVIFPLLGLLAFSIMWTQYMVALVQQLGNYSADLQTFYGMTGWVFVVLILLHPSLLIAQRFLDGYGLPPHSFESYVAPSLAWVTLLGSACLLVFLIYTARKLLRKYPWWRFIAVLNDLAALGIFYHSLRLGSQLQTGWFRNIWYFYGVSIIVAIGFKYYRKLRPAQAQDASLDTKRSLVG